MRIPPLSLFLLAVLPAMAAIASTETRLWEPVDIAFKSQTGHDNPFLVDFSATVTRPDGGTLKTLGYFDGEGTWKIRLSCDAGGEWKIRTASSDPELDGKEATVVCSGQPREGDHGPLKIDPEHPYHFLYADGTRYFLNGYECDWLWALDTDKPELPTISPFLKSLAEYGFNHLILNTYAHDTSWHPGNEDPHDYGPAPMYAWEGTNENPDHSRMNLAFWNHYDRVIAALDEHGIVAHIMIKVYNKKVKWPKRRSREDDLFFNWVVARYAAFPNVVWDFSKEAHNEKDLDYKLSRFELIKVTDPYQRLRTNHDDNDAFNEGKFDNLLDFRSDQCHKNWYKTLRAQRDLRQWPVVNVEFGYEQGIAGPEDKTYGVVQPAEELVRRAWIVCLAGGYPAYYYTNTAWDVILPEQVPTGYTYFKNLRNFFEETGYWKMNPNNGRVEPGHALAHKGEEYILLQDEPREFTFNPDTEGVTYTARWYHPFTGKWNDAGEVGDGDSEFKVPDNWGEAPLILHVKRKE